MKTDKLLHFLCGYIIAAVVTSIFGVAIGIVTAIAAGLLKEIIWDDALEKGTPELLDFIATVIGVIAWIGTYLLLI